MNSHLKSIPCLRSFTTRSLSGCNLQGLSWETNGALDSEVLGLRTLNELLADLLEGLDISAGEGNADLVGFLQVLSLDVSKLCAGQSVLGHRQNLPSLACCMTWLRFCFLHDSIVEIRQSDEGDRAWILKFRSSKAVDFLKCVPRLRGC